jgi:aminoglycoside phosphotransferase (APT) family kinase protein
MMPAMDEHTSGVEWVDPEQLTISTRGADELRVQLERWLAARSGDASASIPSLERPSANGMSSETVLFDAQWQEGGAAHSGEFAARLRPAADAYPIFQEYDLTRQAQVMRFVGERTEVPVPEVVFDEPSDVHLGTPFFVMRRISGLVPPDVMPYPMGAATGQPTSNARRWSERVEVLRACRLDGQSDEWKFLEYTAGR